ncbi:hypothetical protein A4R26_09890 [Niastella populi]|uniref:Uncharacterized protein n=1 Tax=Niastella populi TaxID=550983 RepID=A0A1V9EI25_9BACT|nr:hypothetical protein A4R26_09890 [Niastella populi]
MLSGVKAIPGPGWKRIREKLNLGIRDLRINFGPRNAKHKEKYKDYQDRLHTRGRLRTTLYTNIFRGLPTEREGLFIFNALPENSVQPKKQNKRSKT